MVEGLQVTIRHNDAGTSLSGGLRAAPLRRWTTVVALLAATAIAGCDKLPSRDAATGAADAVASDGMALADSDIEAPEVFSKTELGLWDGRPSLGGVWVAHPEVTDPERVIIRNTANGNFVIGALFRRELENPGPALQVSSDAAEALGLLAGAPETLEVVALRRAEAPASTATAITDFEAPEVIAAEPLDDAAPTTDGAAAAPVTETALADAPAAAAPAAAPLPLPPAGPPSRARSCRSASSASRRMPTRPPGACAATVCRPACWRATARASRSGASSSAPRPPMRTATRCWPP